MSTSAPAPAVIAVGARVQDCDPEYPDLGTVVAHFDDGTLLVQWTPDYAEQVTASSVRQVSR